MENEPILLLTHNGWGLELVKSVQMIVGEVTNVHEVALQAEDSPTELPEAVSVIKMAFRPLEVSYNLLIPPLEVRYIYELLFEKA